MAIKAMAITEGITKDTTKDTAAVDTAAVDTAAVDTAAATIIITPTKDINNFYRGWSKMNPSAFSPLMISIRTGARSALRIFVFFGRILNHFDGIT